MSEAVLYCLSPFASKNARLEISSHIDTEYVWLTIFWTNDGLERCSEPLKISRNALREALSA
jgi:hypothetical protein